MSNPAQRNAHIVDPIYLDIDLGFPTLAHLPEHHGSQSQQWFSLITKEKQTRLWNQLSLLLVKDERNRLSWEMQVRAKLKCQQQPRASAEHLIETMQRHHLILLSGKSYEINSIALIISLLFTKMFNNSNSYNFFREKLYRSKEAASFTNSRVKNITKLNQWINFIFIVCRLGTSAKPCESQKILYKHPGLKMSLLPFHL